MLELAEFIARSRPEADQAAFKQSIEEATKSLRPQEGSEPDVKGKGKILSQLVDAVDGVGEGSERGACRTLKFFLFRFLLTIHRG